MAAFTLVQRTTSLTPHVYLPTRHGSVAITTESCKKSAQPYCLVLISLATQDI